MYWFRMFWLRFRLIFNIGMWLTSWYSLNLNYALFCLLNNLHIFFFNDSSLIHLIFLHFCFFIKQLLKLFNEMRMEERLLILKKFWFLFDEFCPVHLLFMTISLFICVFEENFSCVGSFNPSDFAFKGFIIRFSIFCFQNNSTFFEQLRSEFMLLSFFDLVFHMVFWFTCSFRSKRNGRAL